MKDDIKITDNQIIVVEFYSFLSNIAQTSTDHFSNRCHNSILFSPTNETESIHVVKTHIRRSTGFPVEAANDAITEVRKIP